MNSVLALFQVRVSDSVLALKFGDDLQNIITECLINNSSIEILSIYSITHFESA